MKRWAKRLVTWLSIAALFYFALLDFGQPFRLWVHAKWYGPVFQKVSADVGSGADLLDDGSSTPEATLRRLGYTSVVNCNGTFIFNHSNPFLLFAFRGLAYTPPGRTPSCHPWNGFLDTVPWLGLHFPKGFSLMVDE